MSSSRVQKVRPVSLRYGATGSWAASVSIVCVEIEFWMPVVCTTICNLTACPSMSLQEQLASCEKQNQEAIAANDKQAQDMDSKIKATEEEAKACASKSDDNYYHHTCHSL